MDMNEVERRRLLELLRWIQDHRCRSARWKDRRYRFRSADGKQITVSPRILTLAGPLIIRDEGNAWSLYRLTPAGLMMLAREARGEAA